MPQLDIITFLNQVFWLFLFFIFFYLVLIKSLLPSLAFAIKLRKKKLAIGSFFIERLFNEIENVNLFYTSFLKKNLSNVSINLLQKTTFLNSWSDSCLNNVVIAVTLQKVYFKSFKILYYKKTFICSWVLGEVTERLLCLAVN
mmetsp:Transcript_24903/g.53732  ORF Transcript_24903/g.53732 Transcript_24903/m.53732 type:complete len:143 (-) Transcript_24903:179-607(-)